MVRSRKKWQNYQELSGKQFRERAESTKAESFPWNKSCKFIGEVTEAEYNKQFEPEPELDLIYY